ncbi:fluoride efflux transporter CrcB [Gordonia sp. TBRC 11910]|uniref:Fluoride-specific ion channel FluC n=1 Tax=Gordonia asplenii TaxID=2725283 RepID=A0A848L5R9_9ACTN|nr:fluoride efflux transporter CrcB [Gordonia asplenii]NMO04365.1 fluoride efflux transporter CrcB [Gordonia asplenii]
MPSTRPLHRQPTALAAVFAGGVVGTAARYFLELAFPPAQGGWPWATFCINLGGAALLGLISAILVAGADDSPVRQRLRLFAATGCCGAFTTYSTFALEQTNLWRHGAPVVAVTYAAVSVAGGVLAAWAGFSLGNVVSAWSEQ